ncbi:hypothetical protein E2C01_071797 [Portunus trituberculatus]|uniref:Uncharacterized protein n=1 Tax=Portunus trituberculatus TaxID=210409 RepID=A0A5B7I5D7_PORTR|nr:hypothetical protein [Portunus trituberculatus]
MRLSLTSHTWLSSHRLATLDRDCLCGRLLRPPPPHQDCTIHKFATFDTPVTTQRDTSGQHLWHLRIIKVYL